MNRNIKKAIYIGLLSILLILLALLFISIKNKDDRSYPINSLRLDSNDVYINVQNLWSNDKFMFDDIANNAKDRGISISIINLYQEVIYSNSKYFDIDNVPILQEALYMDASYLENNLNVYKLSQPLYKEEMVTGFVIFEKEYIYESSVNYLTIILGIIILTIVCFIILLYGISLFKSDNYEFIEIEKGLLNITKGLLTPISTNKDSQYPQIYITYNMLIEELKHVMQQREYTQGQRKSFLTTISHELKTPIATISAYVEGLKSGVADDDEKRQQYINIIYQKMKMLNKLIEDFFLYTQEDENKFKYNFSECYADVFIGDIFSSISSQKNSRTAYKNLLPKCIINVDQFRIEQVILNLYNNAKKHTNKDQDILLLAYREEDNIVIEVSDNGEGISPKDLPYIFEYYYQGSKSKSKDYQGVGLGLAIAKSIIDAHNGRMKVKSTEGSGTSMYVYIPVV